LDLFLFSFLSGLHDEDEKWREQKYRNNMAFMKPRLDHPSSTTVSAFPPDGQIWKSHVPDKHIYVYI
jgi:hypothetical protein